MDWYRTFFGTTSRKEEEEDESITEPSKPRDAVAYSNRKSYNEIKRDLLYKGKLFYDVHFPAKNASLYFSMDPPVPFVWKRPHEIVDHPQLFVDDASRFDVAQGMLGDCWLLAAIASLCDNKTLLNQIIPCDQGFEQDYCGMFRFRFWRYGRWEEVVVDDRLPTHNGKLVFLHSTDNREFWTALLEKAYAKLHGSYEALSGGHTSDSMVDFTGGVTESYELKGKEPDNLFDLMLSVQKRQSLLCASISQMKGEVEYKLDNGLVMGHAYTVSGVARVSTRGYELLRVRNPWGDGREWNGAWSDGSAEWSGLSEKEQRSLGLAFQEDGEYWMSFADFCINFDRVDICLLSPAASTSTHAHDEYWEMRLHQGTWQKFVSAGGCRMFPDTFHLNPQYRITLDCPDEDSDENKCTIVLGLMQKSRRKARKHQGKRLTIGFSLYQLKEDASRYMENGRLNEQFFLYHPSTARTDTFLNSREVTGRFLLPMGEYVVIPSTFNPDEEGDFIVRMFSEKPHKADCMDADTKIEIRDENPTKEEDAEFDDKFKRFFEQTAGDDGEIDPFELHGVISSILKTKGSVFTIDACRSMFSMVDLDRTGKLDYDEFRLLWRRITEWEENFNAHKKNKDGDLLLTELRSALSLLGFQLKTSSLSSTASRWGTRSGGISLQDYIHLCCRVKGAYDNFASLEENKFSVNDYVMQAIYI